MCVACLTEGTHMDVEVPMFGLLVDEIKALNPSESFGSKISRQLQESPLLRAGLVGLVGVGAFRYRRLCVSYFSSQLLRLRYLPKELRK